MARSASGEALARERGAGSALTIPRVGDLRPYLWLALLTVLALTLAYVARPLVRIDLGGDHDAIFLRGFNGREIDAIGTSATFAWPPDAATGQAWVREMTGLIHAIDPLHPVTCGLHAANIHQDNGLRVDQVYAETVSGSRHCAPLPASPPASCARPRSPSMASGSICHVAAATSCSPRSPPNLAPPSNSASAWSRR